MSGVRSRWERSAASSLGGQFPFVLQEPFDLVCHGIERRGGGPQFGGAVLADAHLQPPLPERAGRLGEPLGRAHQARPEPVGHGDRADDQAEAHPGEDQPGAGDTGAHRLVRHVHLHHRELARREGRRLEQDIAAGHRRDGGPAAAGRLHVARGGAAAAYAVRLTGPGAGGTAGDVDGQPALSPGLRAGDRPFELAAVGGDGERGPDLGGAALGVGERPVTRELPDHQPERHGEGEHHHHGDGERDPDQRPSHARSTAAGGASSFTPTPRTVRR
ncbi:hypothetical protein GCM10010214_06660 [Streptomyces abikoensis]|nr:hypothetical protein GCM10010214_06660 [Streptomyces abikoensis]